MYANLQCELNTADISLLKKRHFTSFCDGWSKIVFTKLEVKINTLRKERKFWVGSTLENSCYDPVKYILLKSLVSAWPLFSGEKVGGCLCALFSWFIVYRYFPFSILIFLLSFLNVFFYFYNRYIEIRIWTQNLIVDTHRVRNKDIYFIQS